MGHEKTEPNSKVIAFWGIVVIVSLFALVPFFHAYFQHMTNARHEANLNVACDNAGDCASGGQCLPSGFCESSALVHQRTQRGKRGDVSAAMKRLAQGRRNGPLPQPSSNLDAVSGWAQTTNADARRDAELASKRTQ